MFNQITIYATIKGRIWLPPVECWKEVKEVFTPVQQPFTREWLGLENALDVLTNDGDFQGCYITNMVMEVETVKGNKRTFMDCNINPKAKILQPYLHKEVKEMGEFTYQEEPEYE